MYFSHIHHRRRIRNDPRTEAFTRFISQGRKLYWMATASSPIRVTLDRAIVLHLAGEQIIHSSSTLKSRVPEGPKPNGES